MEFYTCSPCGWIYKPKDGYPEGGIAPGTSFDDLPEDFTCPICGVGKAEFVKSGS